MYDKDFLFVFLVFHWCGFQDQHTKLYKPDLFKQVEIALVVRLILTAHVCTK